MKIKALITLVVGRGTEIAPNEITDVSDSEAKKLIERDFAEEVVKTNNSRSKPTPPPTKPAIIPPPQLDEDEEPEEDEQGEDDDNPNEQSGQQPV